MLFDFVSSSVLPGLFMNTAAPSLVHLSATNFFYPRALSLPQAAFTLSVVSKHSYGLHRKSPLQINARRDHHSDS